MINKFGRVNTTIIPYTIMTLRSVGYRYVWMFPAGVYPIEARAPMGIRPKLAPRRQDMCEGDQVG